MAGLATGSTVNRSLKNKAAIRVTAAIDHAAGHVPFPILDIDSDCRSQENNRAVRDADPASWLRRSPWPWSGWKASLAVVGQALIAVPGARRAAVSVQAGEEAMDVAVAAE